VKEEKQANGRVTSADLPCFFLYEEASAEQTPVRLEKVSLQPPDTWRNVVPWYCRSHRDRHRAPWLARLAICLLLMAQYRIFHWVRSLTGPDPGLPGCPGEPSHPRVLTSGLLGPTTHSQEKLGTALAVGGASAV